MAVVLPFALERLDRDDFDRELRWLVEVREEVVRLLPRLLVPRRLPPARLLDWDLEPLLRCFERLPAERELPLEVLLPREYEVPLRRDVLRPDPLDAPPRVEELRFEELRFDPLDPPRVDELRFDRLDPPRVEELRLERLDPLPVEALRFEDPREELPDDAPREDDLPAERDRLDPDEVRRVRPEELARPRLRPELRLEPLSAVSRDTSLLKLLCWPAAVFS